MAHVSIARQILLWVLNYEVLLTAYRICYVFSYCDVSLGGGILIVLL